MNMQKNTYKDIIFRGIGTLVFCILYLMVLKGCRTNINHNQTHNTLLKSKNEWEENGT